MVVGLVGFCLLPWYAVDDGFWSFGWLLDGWPLDEDAAPALFLVVQGEKPWLAPLGLVLLLPLLTAGRDKVGSRPSAGCWSSSAPSGSAGFWCRALPSDCAAGATIGCEALFGEFDGRQFGMGYGALATALAFLFLLTLGIAARGAVGGDVFVVGAIGFVIATVDALRLRADRADAAERLRHRRRLLARGFRRAPLLRPPLVARLPDGGPALRRRLELLLPRRPRRHPLDAARPRLRARRHPHRLPLPPHPSRPDRAADHHARLRHRPRGDPPLRPLRLLHPRRGRRFSASSRPAGSMVFPACSSPRRSPSPRSPSSC